MKKIIATAMVSAGFLAGCAGANISSAKWDTNHQSTKIQTRCVELDMRDSGLMEKVFSKYDGWKLIYVSEYTTENKVGTSGVACFERENQ